MRRHVALVAALWLAGAALAVIGATAALSLLGDGVFGPGGKPLTQADVQRALARPAPAGSASQAGSAPATPGRRQARGPTPSPMSSAFASSGGTVFASCSSGQVTLTTRIPAQGYQVDSFSPGPAPSAWVKFKSGATELTIIATCASGRPHFVTSADTRGGGGGDHGGARGGGSADSGSSPGTRTLIYI